MKRFTEEIAYRPPAQTVCCWPRSGYLPEGHQTSGAQLALAVVEGSLVAYDHLKKIIKSGSGTEELNDCKSHKTIRKSMSGKSKTDLQ